MSKKPQAPTTAAGHRKQLMDALRRNAHRYDLHSVWSDFVEMSAIALSNAVDMHNREEREARYMQIVGKYDADEVVRFTQALASLFMAFEECQFDDVLGATFMELELGNKHTGQFFTPYSISHMMGRMHVDNGARNLIDEYGYITCNDPCIGGGAMAIGIAHALFEADINPQVCLHITAQDLDRKAVHMAYVQLSILHIPAMVILGNTLQNERLDVWYTPAHILDGWSFKLRHPRSKKAPEVAKPLEPIIFTHQSSLFEEAA